MPNRFPPWFRGAKAAAGVALALGAAGVRGSADTYQAEWAHVVGYTIHYSWTFKASGESDRGVAAPFIVRAPGPFGPAGVRGTTSFGGQARLEYVSIATPDCHWHGNVRPTGDFNGTVRLIVDPQHGKYSLEVWPVRIPSGCYKGSKVGEFNTRAGLLHPYIEVCGKTTSGGGGESNFFTWHLTPITDNHAEVIPTLGCPEIPPGGER